MMVMMIMVMVKAINSNDDEFDVERGICFYYATFHGPSRLALLSRFLQRNQLPVLKHLPDECYFFHGCNLDGLELIDLILSTTV